MSRNLEKTIHSLSSRYIKFSLLSFIFRVTSMLIIWQWSQINPYYFCILSTMTVIFFFFFAFFLFITFFYRLFFSFFRSFFLSLFHSFFLSWWSETLRVWDNDKSWKAKAVHHFLRLSCEDEGLMENFSDKSCFPWNSTHDCVLTSYARPEIVS